MIVNVVDQIFDLFDRFGSHHYGEATTQLQHALQTADLARASGSQDALVAAALLHDIGQLMGNAGAAAEHGSDARHEIIGARFLSLHFAENISEPVRLHVAAKRYLCAVDGGYAAGLSAASLLSLRLQGGPMTPVEIAAFEAERFFKDAVALRLFDDGGKRADRQAPALAGYRELLDALRVAPAE